MAVLPLISPLLPVLGRRLDGHHLQRGIGGLDLGEVGEKTHEQATGADQRRPEAGAAANQEDEHSAAEDGAHLHEDADIGRAEGDVECAVKREVHRGGVLKLGGHLEEVTERHAREQGRE